MELLSPGHLIVVLVVAAVLFFGWKQLPDMARSAGRSLRVFRTEVKGLSDEVHTSVDAIKTTETPAVVPGASTTSTHPAP